LRATLSVEPRNFNYLLHGNYYYHKIAWWGDFVGFYFVVNGAPGPDSASSQRQAV
jgi:hypothetical protein